MKKYQFKIAIKGMMNSVRNVGGVNIANVAWRNKPWMIIENDETFEEAKEREFIPIDEFRTSDDLYTIAFGGKYYKTI